MKAKEYIERVKKMIAGITAIGVIKEEHKVAVEYTESLDEARETLLEMIGRKIEWEIDEHEK
jgi:hypothetical protein